MVNLIVEKEEVLEALPKFANHHEAPNGCEFDTRYYDREGYPWKRVNRWLVAQTGRHMDAITHDFVNLLWVPPAKRTYSQLTHHIEVHTFWNKGRIFYTSRYDNEPMPVDYGNYYSRYDLFYVHPDSRTLCRFQRKNKHFYRKVAENRTIKIIGNYHQFLKLDGNWFEVKARLTKKGELPLIYKDPHDRLIGDDDYHAYYYYSHQQRPGVIITLKRQLNKKELKAHGLKNEVKFPPGKVCSVCGGMDCDPLRHKFSGKLSEAA